MSNLGYACINITLGKKKITTNRSMIKKTFLKEGIDRASELGLQNTRDLVEIIKWNEQQGIELFRISSNLFPWSSEYQLSSMPHFAPISNLLKGIGVLVSNYGQRITSHPGPFNVLFS